MAKYLDPWAYLAEYLSSDDITKLDSILDRKAQLACDWLQIYDSQSRTDLQEKLRHDDALAVLRSCMEFEAKQVWSIDAIASKRATPSGKLVPLVFSDDNELRKQVEQRFMKEYEYRKKQGLIR